MDITAARSPGEPDSAHEHRRQKAFAAPVIIVLGAAISTGTGIPESEQICRQAATMNMLRDPRPGLWRLLGNRR